MSHDKLFQTFLDLLAAFAPGYYRLGGTRNDLMFFDENSKITLKEQKCSRNTRTGNIFDGSPTPFKPVHLTKDEFYSISNGVQCAGLQFIFGLNLNNRDSNNIWRTENTEHLLDFVQAYDINVNFELGNEPNSWMAKFGKKINPFEQKTDMVILKELLEKRQLKSRIFGPDSTGRKQWALDYLTEFVQFEVSKPVAGIILV